MSYSASAPVTLFLHILLQGKTHVSPQPLVKPLHSWARERQAEQEGTGHCQMGTRRLRSDSSAPC